MAYTDGRKEDQDQKFTKVVERFDARGVVLQRLAIQLTSFLIVTAIEHDIAFVHQRYTQ